MIPDKEFVLSLLKKKPPDKWSARLKTDPPDKWCDFKNYNKKEYNVILKSKTFDGIKLRYKNFILTFNSRL